MKPRRHPPIVNGTRFHRLLVIGNTLLKNGRKAYVCKCDCGEEKLYEASPLLSGKNRSCGCYRKERAGPATTHGRSDTPEWRSWSRMKRRCYNKAGDTYHCYGERGIKVCDRWLNSFDNFLADMGKKPSLLHSIERKDNDGDYEPSNCIWVIHKVQSRNKRTTHWVIYRGTRMSLMDAVELCGADYRLVSLRLRRGWSLEKSIHEPVRLDIRHTGAVGHV